MFLELTRGVPPGCAPWPALRGGGGVQQRVASDRFVSCASVLDVGDAGSFDGPDLLKLNLGVPEVVE